MVTQLLPTRPTQPLTSTRSDPALSSSGKLRVPSQGQTNATTTTTTLSSKPPRLKKPDSGGRRNSDTSGSTAAARHPEPQATATAEARQRRLSAGDPAPAAGSASNNSSSPRRRGTEPRGQSEPRGSPAPNQSVPAVSPQPGQRSIFPKDAGNGHLSGSPTLASPRSGPTEKLAARKQSDLGTAAGQGPSPSSKASTPKGARFLLAFFFCV